MTDNIPAVAKTPSWFTLLSFLALLWEALGCFMYLSQVTTDPSTLPLDQRALWEATPAWSVAAYAIAVWIGLVGAGLLLLRRAAAVPLLFVSLLGVAVQFSALILVPELAGSISSDALLLPVVIFIICYGIFHLALLGKKRGWLHQ